MAWGNALAFFVCIGLAHNINIGIFIAIVMLLTGLVATARLQLQQHNNMEMYWGLFVGVLCQVAAYFIM
jgi:hypothetical protein